MNGSDKARPEMTLPGSRQPERGVRGWQIVELDSNY